MKEYQRHLRHVAKMMAKLELALASHRQWARNIKPRSEVRYMVGDLVYVEGQLKHAIWFITPSNETKSTIKRKGAKK
jgi:hypothetical protein